MLGHGANDHAGLVGGMLVVFKGAMPVEVAQACEVLVGMMIFGLGACLVRHSVERHWTLHSHEHSHDGPTHSHFHIHRKGHVHHQHHLLGGSRKAFAVGMMHGVVGRAALSVAVMTTMPPTLLGILYIIIFGVGSIGGMIAMSVLISVPFIWTARLYNHGTRSSKPSRAF